MNYRNNILKILKEEILPGESKTINMEIAKLHTMTKLKIPIIVERAKLPGQRYYCRQDCTAMKSTGLRLSGSSL